MVVASVDPSARPNRAGSQSGSGAFMRVTELIGTSRPAERLGLARAVPRPSSGLSRAVLTQRALNRGEVRPARLARDQGTFLRPGRPALDTSSPDEPSAPSFAFTRTTSAKLIAHYTQRPALFFCETALSLSTMLAGITTSKRGRLTPTNIKPCRAQRPCQHDPAQSILATPEFPAGGPNRIPPRPAEQGLIEQCHPQCFTRQSDPPHAASTRSA